MELQLGHQVNEKDGPESRLQKTSQYAIFFSEFLGAAVLFMVLNLGIPDINGGTTNENPLLHCFLQGLGLFLASLIFGSLSNQGYFNPAVVLGVLAQQWDTELEPYRRGCLGIIENLKFAAITIFVQFCGSVFGLFLWKAALFKKPVYSPDPGGRSTIGIWFLCPASTNPSYSQMKYIKPDDPLPKPPFQGNDICRPAIADGTSFKLFCIEFFATFMFVTIVLFIKNSSVKLRKLNQREIWKARNFAMKKHLRQTKEVITDRPKEQVMLELVNEDMAFDQKIKSEQDAILEKLTNYELLIQVNKQVEVHDQQKYQYALKHGYFGTGKALEAFSKDNDYDPLDLPAYNAMALGFARFFITLLTVNQTRAVQDPSIAIVQSMFQQSYVVGDEALMRLIKDSDGLYELYLNFTCHLGSLHIYLIAEILGGIVAGFFFLFYERGLTTRFRLFRKQTRWEYGDDKKCDGDGTSGSSSDESRNDLIPMPAEEGSAERRLESANTKSSQALGGYDESSMTDVQSVQMKSIGMRSLNMTQPGSEMGHSNRSQALAQKFISMSEKVGVTQRRNVRAASQD